MGVMVTRQDGDDLRAVSGAFDLVVCEGGVDKAPASWQAALAGGGRLGVVERDGPGGRAVLYLRSEEGVGRRALFDCGAPFLEGFAPAPGFAF